MAGKKVKGSGCYLTVIDVTLVVDRRYKTPSAKDDAVMVRREEESFTHRRVS